MNPGIGHSLPAASLSPFGPYWIDTTWIIGVTPTFNPAGKRGLYLHFHGGGTMLLEEETGVAALDAWLAAQPQTEPAIEGGEIR